MSPNLRRFQRLSLVAALAGAGAGALAWSGGGAGADDVAAATAVERDPAVSGDGRRVVYVAPSGDGPHDSVWLLDRSDGSRTELTQRTAGLRAGRSAHPVLSDDGCSIVVVTELALDLFRDDDRGDRWDVYRTVLPGCPGGFGPGEWELVSSVGDGAVSASDLVEPADRPSIDASGNLVAYTRRLGTPDDPTAPTWRAIEVVDLTVPLGAPGRVTVAPGLPLTGPVLAASYVGQRTPALSGNGRYLAFTTDIDLSVTETETAAIFTGVWTERVLDGVAVTQVVRWDRDPSADDDGALVRVVSATPDGVPGAAASSQPAIDADGDTIAFVSLATGLVAEPPAPVGVSQIYRASLADPPSLELVSTSSAGPADRAVSHPSIDAAGRLIAFESLATNLLTPAPIGFAGAAGADLLLVDTVSGAIRRITAEPTGMAQPYGARSPRLSASGRTVVYETVAAEFPADATGTDGGRFAPVVADESVPTDGSTTDASADAAVTDSSPWRVAVSVAPVELSISDLDLGTAPIGGSTQEWYTTIVNQGVGAFVPATISTTAPEFAVTGGSCTPSVPVLSGETCTVEVTFTPTVEGAAAAELIVAERGFAAVQVRAGLRATGGIPNVVGLPSSLGFGDALVQFASEPQTVTFANNGIAETAVASVQRGGTHPDDFVVLTDGCSGRLLSVGETCVVSVAFAPLDGGPRSATLTASASSGATSGVVLVGAGIYRPLAAVEQRAVTAPGRVDVGGIGFPANSYVTVGWSGEAGTALVLTDARGEFRARLEAPRSLGGGRRTVVVVDPANRFDPIATPEVLVTVASGAGGSSPAHRGGR